MDVCPGMVFYLPFRSLYGQAGTSYNKFAIVARTDPDILMLMVCTEIAPFARNNDKLRRSYVEIDKTNHKFLDYDSWVDCNDAKDEYSLLALKEAYANDASCYVGDVSRDALRKIVGGVDTSVKLERRKKASISSALSRAINT